MSLRPLPTGIPVRMLTHLRQFITWVNHSKKWERQRVCVWFTNPPFFKKKNTCHFSPLKTLEETVENKERWTGGYREGKKNQAATSYISFLARVFWHKGVFEEAETGRIVSQRLASSTGERARETSSPRLSTTRWPKERGGSLVFWHVLAIRKYPQQQRDGVKDEKDIREMSTRHHRAD